MKEFLFFSYLAGVALINWHGLYEPAKVIWLYFGAIPLFLYWITRLLKQKDINLKKADYLYLFWLIILGISGVLNGRVLESLIGTGYRHQGIIFFLVIWVFGISLRTFSATTKKLFIKGIIWLVIIQTLFVLYQALSHAPVISTFGETNAVAGFILPGLSFISNPFLFALVSSGALATGSKIAIFVIFVVLLIKLPINKNKKYFLSLLLIFITSLLMLSKTITLSSNSPFENRSTIWKYAISAIMQKPFFGYGLEANEVLFDRMFAHDNLPLDSMIIDRAHNIFLDVSIWSGLVGATFFVSWLGLSFKDVKNNKTLTLSGVILLLFAFFQPLGVTHWVLLMTIFNLQTPEVGYS